MKVRIYYGDANEIISKLIDNLDIELSRVPNVGESLSLWVEDYWLDMKVRQVFTNYCIPGNPHIKERAWGEGYAVFVDDVMIVEEYRKKK